MVTQLSEGYLRLYKSFKVGNLVFKGGLFDQPEKYLMAMDILTNYIIEHNLSVEHNC